MTYGTFRCGFETMRQAWSGIDHVFSVGASYPTTAEFTYPVRPPINLLRRRPVDLLVVERGTHTKIPQRGFDVTRDWKKLVEEAVKRPTLVFESWSTGAGTWENGPVSKATTTQWEKLGYLTRCRLVEATRVGGAVTQTRLLVIRVRSHSSVLWNWPKLGPVEPPRPMSNLLRPSGLIGRRGHRKHPPSHVTKTHDPARSPMPWQTPSRGTAWIRTEGGYRSILLEELGRAVGVTGDDLSSSPQPGRGLDATTSVYHWEYLSHGLKNRRGSPSQEAQVLEAGVTSALQDELGSTPLPASADPGTRCTWAPPDLRPGRQWYKNRVNSLFEAVRQTGEDFISLVNNGLDALAGHRLNYDETGPAPRRLQLLWWEFPVEHRKAIREGSRMNFLRPPAPGIHPNMEMNPEQREVARRFVEELIGLRVLQKAPPDMILTTTPLFTVEKPGQPGEWRVIADMLRGGQNRTAANEPVYLNRPLHILEQMHAGGWTAVIDASKFFYQFRTRPEDYPYLGVVHPVTDELYYWASLPMGGANSPACAGRYGQAFLRLLRETLRVEGHSPRLNCWWTGFSGTGYDPLLGYGYVLTGPDGAPAVRFWVHVDDFAIHGPTLATTTKAMNVFLDVAVRVGMLCHPGKLKPPSQTPMYTGFIFDTRGIPTLRVPTAKREKALAMVDMGISWQPGHKVSRLVLAVITGTLESLAEATPARLGHTYLRRLYHLIHPEEGGGDSGKYFTYAEIGPGIRADLIWWKTLLEADISRPARPLRAAQLVPTFGDGSGTGTGGTMLLPSGGLTMWMGQWTPFIFSCSSNWKELKTLLLTLQRLASNAPDEVRGATLFYFTDNSTTYYVCASGSSRSPGLHDLVEQIRRYELLLECQLQVVHVPGVLLIMQGTDGLSRGIWASDLQTTCDQSTLTAGIFAPLPRQTQLEDRYTKFVAPDRDWHYSPWATPLQGGALLHCFTLHYPPPEIARQVLTLHLEAWVESPWDTGAVFFVPRVVSAFWHGLSRHIQELEQIPSSDLVPEPALPIPCIVLTVLPYRPALSDKHDRRLDAHRLPWQKRRIHERAAQAVRGLPTTALQPGY